uniref:Pre-mRNA-splicing factor Syf1-like N-terminal HAT-repeats domain-containing protein n=1 Tax=Ananas comosus var. bracteatus TaxID=296719 RepID=A0A6V7PUQ0_ANACO|nr:unnamed protein product [Ananas comosus var. bracteatus]
MESEFLTKRDTDVRLPWPRLVKNKAPAKIQITAEQILREARERQEPDIRRPKQKIVDPHELSEHRLRKRKEFEEHIRRARRNPSAWVKYALWEESHGDFARARSVWERALDVDYRNHVLWLKYVEFEMRNGFVNHARNVWDRAVSLLPRVDQLWWKYIHMEEMLRNVAAARQLFERWMQWRPDAQGWLSYVKFELRYGETDHAFIRYAEFETKWGGVARARAIHERAADLLSEDDEEAEKLFVAFKEVERARCIYKYALDCIPKERAEDLYRKFVSFENRYGDPDGIEDAIVRKRRCQYEEEVRRNSLNYDSWFDYIRLEESVGNKDVIRKVYERAIANVPPAVDKRYWQRYIYLWINYLLYEELHAQDMARTKEIYRKCLKLISCMKVSFAKIWIMAAQFEIRQMNLEAARKILGNAIGIAPKDKIFKNYIKIELQLGNLEKKSLFETERARAVFELAIAQPTLDMPELLWKAYIDFEISEHEYERTRQLYERLLDRTRHLKVWISYAKFEASAGLEVEEADGKKKSENHDASSHEQQMQCIQRCRAVFERASDYFRANASELKEERAMLLEEWLNMESSFGSLGCVNTVQKKLPRKIKRKRAITTEDDTPIGFEEYYDYIFPDEVAMISNLKILEAAYKWKRQKVDNDDDR